MAANGQANDAMIRRLERELEERNNYAQVLISNVEDQERDLSIRAQASLADCRNRMGAIRPSSTSWSRRRDRQRGVGEGASTSPSPPPAALAPAGGYRCRSARAGLYKAHLGDREARERLEVFARTAAHQKTTDNLGVIPDPIVGNVVNFIDAARPLVSFIGPQDLPSNTWHRPKVTQHTTVAAQGSAGAAADEKAELVSQKMTITRLNANAVTYGGYVNVSRQNIDFTNGQVMDLIINDLAAQYAIEIEAAAAANRAPPRPRWSTARRRPTSPPRSGRPWRRSTRPPRVRGGSSSRSRRTPSAPSVRCSPR
jgi:HK97 family phage major capsid protein